MNNSRLIYKIFAFVFAGLMLSRCAEDSVSTSVQGIAIEDMDLIQIEDASPNLPVSFTAQSGDLKSVTVTATPVDGGTAVLSNTLRNITKDRLNRVKLNVPFPTPDVAPSGLYTVAIAIDGQGSNGTISYNVNVLNNRTVKYCDFPAPVAGKVNIFVSVPAGSDVAAAGKDIYIVGNFMVKNGAAGDWNAGDPAFKLTKLGENCYTIALDKFDSGDKFKFTMGSWDTEFLGAKGEGLPDQTAPGGNVNLIIYNFKTLPVQQYEIPQLLPNAAIQSGKMTAVFDVGAYESASKYYLVKKGATSLDGAIEMTNVAGTSKVAGAGDKDEATDYIVVKNSIENKGVNAYGFEQTVTWDGETNPSSAGVRSFSTDAEIDLNNVFMVGGATPGGWANPVPDPEQKFTKVSEGHYELTVALTSGQAYLFLPVNGSWDNKWGTATGGKLAGDLKWAGSDFSSPDESGTYKIELDFTKGAYGTYKLTKQ